MRIQTGKQPVRVFGDLQQPLPERLSHDRVVSPFGPEPFRGGYDLLICQHRAQRFAVPDRYFRLVGETALEVDGRNAGLRVVGVRQYVAVVGDLPGRVEEERKQEDAGVAC